MALLIDPESQSEEHETSNSLQNMPQIWMLVLDSFESVSVSKLIEARIFETLIKAFLKTTEEI
jgi:hypothetical protein